MMNNISEKIYHDLMKYHVMSREEVDQHISEISEEFDKEFTDEEDKP